MKRLRSLIVAAGMIGLLTGVAEADEFCASSVIRTWMGERDAAAAQLVKLWLRNAGADAVRRAGLELVRWEALLLPCAPPLRIEDFYLHATRGDADPERLPPTILAVLLRRHGIDLDPQAFLVGRAFRLRVVE